MINTEYGMGAPLCQQQSKMLSNLHTQCASQDCQEWNKLQCAQLTVAVCPHSLISLSQGMGRGLLEWQSATHLNARYSEVWDLEFYADGRHASLLLFLSLYTW